MPNPKGYKRGNKEKQLWEVLNRERERWFMDSVCHGWPGYDWVPGRVADPGRPSLNATSSARSDHSEHILRLGIRAFQCPIYLHLINLFHWLIIFWSLLTTTTKLPPPITHLHVSHFCAFWTHLAALIEGFLTLLLSSSHPSSLACYGLVIIDHHHQITSTHNSSACQPFLCVLDAFESPQ
ncbi:hypothetical protein F5880DRAFT_1616846 [Lentinula raphanica]|nr:hypothetical protein F5880DRAFT_1616846 [Lentinula raphanica]